MDDWQMIAWWLAIELSTSEKWAAAWIDEAKRNLERDVVAEPSVDLAARIAPWVVTPPRR
jgi:hypothetical protein